MKHFFANKQCPGCGKKYDPILESCPDCKRSAEDLDQIKGFSNHVKISWLKQLLCFAIGWMGFQIIGLTIQMVITVFMKAQNQGMGVEELTKKISEFLASAQGLCIVNTVAYCLVIGILVLVNLKNLKRFISPFANWRTYAFGAAGFALLFMASLTVSVIIGIINPSSGGDNQNQKTLIEILTKYPYVGFVVFGVFGPLCEEITYRVGLFGLLSRWNKIGAYIVTILVFAFIHFGWSSVVSDSSKWGVELLNLPSYIAGGTILCIIYDKFGFGASALAHVSYNLVACAMSVIK